MSPPLAVRSLSLLLLLACTPAAQGPVGPAEPLPGAFEAHWYDGQAEVNGYRWSGMRYGELRAGEAVAIFVTETLGAKEHVKVDRPEEYRGDTLTALKLNLVRDFQTGVYDYNTMASAWAGVDDLRALKLTFSSAEWCGHVYEELDVRAKGVALDVRSYFQGESQQMSLASKPDGLLGEHLLVWLRGLRGHVLAPGEERGLPYLADPFERRLRHVPASWGTVRVTREREPAEVRVPAGSFSALRYRLEASDGRTGRVEIEAAYPHRLLAWEWQRGAEVLDAAELTGTKRMKYWELQKSAQAALRAELGLDPR